MYVKTIKKTSKSGTVRYLHLAHNEWDPVVGRSVPKVLYTFGREDRLDHAAIRRLIGSLSRLVTAEEGPARPPAADPGPGRGDIRLLDRLWRSLAIDTAILDLAADTHRDPAGRQAVERLLFALVAARTLAPSARLLDFDRLPRGHGHEVPGTADEGSLTGLAHWIDDVRGELESRIVQAVTARRDVDTSRVILHDSSLYFETGRRPGQRLTTVPVTLAVTREGVPLYCRPQEHDGTAHAGEPPPEGLLATAVIRIHEHTGREGNVPSRPDAPDASPAVRAAPGARVPDVETALSRPGRYRGLTPTVRVKEVRDGTFGGRLVLCHDRVRAAQDGAARLRLLTEVRDAITATDALGDRERSAIHARLAGHPRLAPYVRVTAAGRLRVDRTRVRSAQRADGKFLLHCPDDSLSAEEVARAYLRLRDTDRRWADLRQVVDLRGWPHGTGVGVRVHRFLCWLSLLLACLAETGEQPRPPRRGCGPV
ncbi:hypothetical protein [Streptomyces sp. NPDC057340]|uniref:hypothetical protein n=1 Tax=Streptomyces sp. NPDC057340 TaxID=3346103 RepID=UPI003633EDE1